MRKEGLEGGENEEGSISGA